MILFNGLMRVDEVNMKVDNVLFTNCPRARARFVDCRSRGKRFLVKKRKYKGPDFARMILDLRNLNWSHEKISYLCGVGASAVSQWATGRKPYYENGDMLIMLWRDQTGLERVPRIGEELTYQYEINSQEKLPRPSRTRAEQEMKVKIFETTLDGIVERLDQEIVGE